MYIEFLKMTDYQQMIKNQLFIILVVLKSNDHIFIDKKRLDNVALSCVLIISLVFFAIKSDEVGSQNADGLANWCHA